MPTNRSSIDIEGYNHGQPIPCASRKGPLLVTGGIAGLDTAAGKVPDDVAEQTRIMFENMKAVLTQAGGSFDDVVKMTFFVKSKEAKGAINAEWEAAFPDPSSRPARHTLSYDDFPANVQIQCDALAWIENNG